MMAIRRSALRPDDISDFEDAAADGGDLGPLAPPYDTRSEHRTHASHGEEPVSISKMDQFIAVLRKNDKLRVWVMRSHIKWAHKMAIKNGIDPQEVNLWEL